MRDSFDCMTMTSILESSAVPGSEVNPFTAEAPLPVTSSPSSIRHPAASHRHRKLRRLSFTWEAKPRRRLSFTWEAKPRRRLSFTWEAKSRRRLSFTWEAKPRRRISFTWETTILGTRPIFHTLSHFPCISHHSPPHSAPASVYILDSSRNLSSLIVFCGKHGVAFVATYSFISLVLFSIKN